VRANWLSWVATDRAAYAAQLGQEAAGVNAAAEADAAARLRNLQQDEAWKVAHCRYCPHCQRVINKLEGCDSMRCGQDAHGGNVQNGCGRNFSWGTAAPYQAAVCVAQAAAVQAVRVEDMVRGEHAGIGCSICGVKPIVGPRFECLHCPSSAEGQFNACLKCEAQLHAPGGHPPGHAFTPKMPPNVADAAAHAEGVAAAGAGGGGDDGGHCIVM
jgi:hypothetical protein